MKKKRFNPFYVLLVLVGIAFLLTACGYGVMTVRQIQLGEMSASDQFFDTYGVKIMVGQVAVLAILSAAAMGTENYWTQSKTELDDDDASKAQMTSDK